LAGGNVLRNGCEHYLEDSITIADWQQRATALPKPIITLNACQDNQASLKLPYHFATIDPGSLKDFISACKQQQVSVNSALNAALVLAYWELIDNYTDTVIGSALNLRNKCRPKIPKDVCGNYFAPVSTPVMAAIADQGFWAMAKHYHQQLGQVISNKYFLPTLYEYDEMTSTIQGFMSKTESIYEERIGSSYMGDISINTNNLRVQQIFIRPKTAGKINMMSTIFNGQLRILLCYPPQYRTQEWIYRLWQLIEQRIRTV
jgi:hypothetical protein